MYAFGPLPRQKRSGRVIGTHQKIDRVARRHIANYLVPSLPFPEIRDILHFEGTRGPDSIRLKSLGEDKPSHFIDPKNLSDDAELFKIIADNQQNLTNALIARDEVRAAFEAAWLAHAVVDGLTPAHHDPFDEQVVDLRSVDDRRDKVRSRVIMSGSGSSKKFIKNNWQYWGAKGIMTTHTLFEAGIATTAKPLMFGDARPSENDLRQLDAEGFLSNYKEMIRHIDSLDMYGRFKRGGWNRTLARDTTKVLLPTAIKAVTLAWSESYRRALEGMKES
jgi:hypothetical protein